MKNIIKIMKDYSLGFIIAAIIVSIITVYATTKIYASSISIDTTNISELASGATLDTAITGLYDRLNSTECPLDYKCYEKFDPTVGDYVKMTPILESFTTDTTYTGYSSTQTITPSELNLWRVIKINDDGTIDMISEYVSSEAVYFQGPTGYKNFVGYLNVLASKYENSYFTVGSRYFGYNGQTEYLTDTANTVESNVATPPWKVNTGSVTVESKGGGDTLYTTDNKLVNEVLGTATANKVGTTTVTEYWVASRSYFYYYYTNSNSYIWSYRGRIVRTTGLVYDDGFMRQYSDGYFKNSYDSYNLRPIVTLKSGLSATGSGTSSDPWILQ